MSLLFFIFVLKRFEFYFTQTVQPMHFTQQGDTNAYPPYLTSTPNVIKTLDLLVYNCFLLIHP